MATEVKQPAKKVKVWKGEKRSGPAPARHIPWPEVFKHHISVVEGHTKMLEMVQKHTVKGTGNYDTITNLVKRSHEMMWQAKDASRSFIPPKNQREMVPLGSSSDSMYPGYSPAHIEYGKAAGEFGQAVGEMKARGEEWKPANGTEYQIGQAHGAKRKTLFQKDRTESTGSEGAAKGASAQPVKAEEEEEEEETLGFVIDVEPTPVKLASGSNKRPLEVESDGAEDRKGKKKKKKTKEENKERKHVVETEDISEEVEARLRLKEKKKSRQEKKRRRESAGDDEEKVVKKPKKDKSKKREAEDGEESSGDGEGKQKKRKKSKDAE